MQKVAVLLDEDIKQVEFLGWASPADSNASWFGLGLAGNGTQEASNVTIPVDVVFGADGEKSCVRERAAIASRVPVASISSSNTE